MNLIGPKSKRHWSGKLAQRRGDLAEDAVEHLHSSPAFKRTHPGVCLTRRHARKIIVKGQTRYAGEQGPDFGGGMPHGSVGRWVEVEVKFVDALKNPRLQLSQFTDAEVRILSMCADARGVAIVLVLVGAAVGVSQWCAVPWRELEPMVAAYRATLNHLGKKQRDSKGKVVTSEAASVNAAWLLRFKCSPMDYLGAVKS